ncbi:MAG: xanthine dehydrogenase family protein subunit M [Pseudomonadota bacterium]
MSLEVFLPPNLPELWGLLHRKPEALAYNGGTDLLIKIRAGLFQPTSLICLERIQELKVVEEREGRIFLGGGASISQLLSEPLVQDHLPVLARALRVLGSPPIRHMATLAGNIVTASPAGDSLPPLYCLEADVVLISPRGARTVNIKDFITGPGKTELKKNELVHGLLVDQPRGCNIQHFEKLGQRNALAISVVSLAAMIWESDSGEVEDARLAWGSVGPTVIRSEKVENYLIGRRLDKETLEKAASLAREEVRPIEDPRASAWYRREVAGNLVLRLLTSEKKTRADERAGEI